MEIVKINGQLGVRITYENLEGIKKRVTLSLKKLAITGLLAIGISASIKPIANEVSFKLEQGRIEKLKETADEISNLENNTTIVGDEEIKIADKVMELAEKREAYNNAKHNKADKEELESLEQEIKKTEEEIYEIGLNETKEQADPHFEDIDETRLRVSRNSTGGAMAHQTDSIIQEKVDYTAIPEKTTEIDSYELDSAFAGNVISGYNANGEVTNTDNIDHIINLMPEFLENGLEISEDGKSLEDGKKL